MSMGGKAWHELGYADTDTGGIKWNEIEKLMKLDEGFNRIDRGNQFGGWEYTPAEYDVDKDGNTVMTKAASQDYVAKSEGMKSAEARMDRRLGGEGFDPYEAPSQVSSITDALMANRMERMGIIDPNTADLKQDEYGTKFADRSGSPTAQPTPQPIQQPAPQPPAAGQPQPPMQPQPPVGGGSGGKPPNQLHGQQPSEEELMAYLSRNGR